MHVMTLSSLLFNGKIAPVKKLNIEAFHDLTSKAIYKQGNGFIYVIFCATKE